MVFFICNHCGASEKKNKVESHSFKCSRTINVSCMDCNKDFDEVTYKEHTQCITEQEKYSAKGFIPKQPSNKNLAKQQTWVSVVNSLIESTKDLPAEDKNLLSIISNYDNIPRKKNKFENFLKNSIFRGSQDCVNRVWALIQQKFSEMKQSNEGTTSMVSSEKKSKGVVEEAENTSPKEVNGVDDKVSQKLSKEKKNKKKTKALEKQSGAVNDSKETIGDVENRPSKEVNGAEDIVDVKLTKKKKRRARKRKAASMVVSADEHKETIHGVENNTPSKEGSDVEDKAGLKPNKKKRKALEKQAEESLKKMKISPEAVDAPEEMNLTVKKVKESKKRKAEVLYGSIEQNEDRIGKENHSGDTSPSPNKKSKEDNLGSMVDFQENINSNQKLKNKKKKKKSKKKSTNTSVNESMYK